MDDLLDILAVGERKQVALSGEAAEMVIDVPDLVADLIAALYHENPTVVSHAAHALLTVFKKAPELLQPQGEALLRAYSRQQWEIKEQLAKILPFLPLTAGQRTNLASGLEETLKTHKSGIARSCALQAITDLAKADEAYITAALGALDFASDQPSKALQARARKLRNSFQKVLSPVLKSPQFPVAILSLTLWLLALMPHASAKADDLVCVPNEKCVEVVLLERLWSRTKLFSRDLAARFLTAHGLAHHIDVHPSRRAKSEMDRGQADMLMYYEPLPQDDVTGSVRPLMEGVIAAIGRRDDPRLDALADHLPDMTVASFHGDELLQMLAPKSVSLGVQNAAQAIELLDRGRVDIVFEYSALVDGKPWMEGLADDKHRMLALTGPRTVHVRFQDNPAGVLLRNAFDNWLEQQARTGDLYELYHRHGLQMSFPAWARDTQARPDAGHERGGR